MCTARVWISIANKTYTRHDSFFFTFVQSVGPFEANDNHGFDVE